MTWREYWVEHAAVIGQALLQWRKSKSARVPLTNLRQKSQRRDLYSQCTVTLHGPSPNVGGKRHMLELGLFLSRQLGPGETVRVRIAHDEAKDYLELF